MTDIAASGIVAFVVAVGIVGVTAVARIAPTFSQKAFKIQAFLHPCSDFLGLSTKVRVYLRLGSSWQRLGPGVKVD